MRKFRRRRFQKRQRGAVGEQPVPLRAKVRISDAGLVEIAGALGRTEVEGVINERLDALPLLRGEGVHVRSLPPDRCYRTREAIGTLTPHRVRRSRRDANALVIAASPSPSKIRPDHAV